MNTLQRAIFGILVLAVITGNYHYLQHLEYSAMHSIPKNLRAFDISDPVPNCGRWKEHMPRERDPAIYKLYIDARKVWRGKIEYQLTNAEAHRILNDVDLAAKQGDWGARSLLSYFYLYGLGRLNSNRVLEPDPEKSIELVQMAVAAGQPWGYYDLGVAYEHGYGGVPFDKAIAWAYYLRAAELGSPEAQMALATAYFEIRRLDAQKAMLMCAFEQEHGAAAYQLGIFAEIENKFTDALAYYQIGTKFGSRDCASALMLFFDPTNWSSWSKDELAILRDLELKPDPERSNRYRAISSSLEINPDLKLGRLDTVLPLPPAELPAWNGIADAIDLEQNGPPTY